MSGALRLGKRHRRTRGVLIPLGLNLAALGFLAAILLVGAEPGGMAVRWPRWLEEAGVTTLVGLGVFRFPRSVGLPLLLVAVALGWLTVGALKSFVPLEVSTELPRAQPLNDRELITAFALRVDTLRVPLELPGVPRELVRWREGNAAPGEWWWPWVQYEGWGRSVGAAMPDHPMKLGVYRLVLAGGRPVWHLVAPEVSVP